ncbi:hypothetical protein QBZ16_004902 [Prototheca wickerhamii]|uniref:ACB domain-containing protein n=1 Tax=Prototheca wickerhamii TaxID=3111 RepID=A0AAD9ML00_PROWI|nr:hypothetical protein QBZ16_004902 [Prototheca wickerhamii]
MHAQEDFEKAAEEAKTLPNALELYGLYKQGTEGDVSTSRPGMFDLKGKAKWDAWNSNKGKDKAAAQQAYIDKVAELKAKYSS